MLCQAGIKKAHFVKWAWIVAVIEGMGIPGHFLRNCPLTRDKLTTII